MKNLEFNKIAAGVLLAGLIGMTTAKIAEYTYRPENLDPHAHGEGHEEKRGYTIEGAEQFAEGAGGGAAAPAKPAGPPEILHLIASADLKAGEDFMKKCASCHNWQKGGPHMVGPNLWGALGGEKGHRFKDYPYSKALSGMSGTWGYEQMTAFLYAPAKYAPGTKMAYAGIKKEQDLANILAYMRTLSDSPLAVPDVKAPEPAAEETAEGDAKSETSEATPEDKALKDKSSGDSKTSDDAQSKDNEDKAKESQSKEAEADKAGTKK